jgi:hypothetical protein
MIKIPNPIDNVIADPTPENRLKASAVISDLARNGASSNNILKDNGSIEQTERLFTTRARYGASILQESGGQNLGGDRGQHAYIKLLTSQDQYKNYVDGKKTRDITYEKLIGSNSDVAKMADTNGLVQKGYDKFLLTGVSCSMSEKVQISEVFGDSEVVYYFGRQPLIFNISGVLIDSADNNWFVDWLNLYNDFLRGSQTAKNYELLKIVLPNMSITGTMSGFSWQQDSNRDTDIPFSFQFIAKIVVPTPATNEGMITSYKLKSVDFSQAYALLSQKRINDFKGQVASLTSVIQNPSSSLRDKAQALTDVGNGLGGTFGNFLNTSKGTLTGIQSTIEGWNKSTQSYVNDVRRSAMYQTVTASLNGIRTNLFSPIYGILSSLTKLVSNTANSATALFNGIITPVRNILRDITSISNQSVALVNLVNSSIKGFGRNVVGQLRGVSSDYKKALKALKKAGGAIGSSPRSVAHTISNMFTDGYIGVGSPFLQSTPKLSFTRPSLTLTVGTTKSKVALLKSVTVYSSELANKL